MKKMWKLNNKAVSPVIATILMVAITVVLAAVLYVMVMGFGGDGGNDTPSGSFTMTEKVGLTEKITFGQITPASNMTEFKVVITDVTASTSTTFVTTNAADFTGGTGLDYVDLAKDTSISAGDYLLYTATAGHTYTVSLIFTETGDLVDDIDFTF
ncbi:MAG: archaellin/type IV pilin N-terminal domain-containing protein [Methanomassiliicoccales archaeon]